MNLGKLIKKLKSVGFVPPGQNEEIFQEMYLAVQPFLAERIEAEEEIKAGFFAFTQVGGAEWGRSIGIMVRVENGFLYAAALIGEDQIKVIGFGNPNIIKMHLTENEEKTAFVGWHLKSEEKVYSFLAVNGAIPKEFLDELIDLEIEFSMGKDLRNLPLMVKLMADEKSMKE